MSKTTKRLPKKANQIPAGIPEEARLKAKGKGTSPSKPKISVEQYASILRGVELTKLCFVDMNAHLNLKNFGSGTVKVDIGNETEFQLTPDCHIVALDKYSVKGFLEEKLVAEIRLHVFVAFACNEDANPEFLEQFMETSLKLFTFPYVRETVQDITAKMGMTPLVLPMWKAPKAASKEPFHSIDG